MGEDGKRMRGVKEMVEDRRGLGKRKGQEEKNVT
jgi:hypothetical protein